MDVDLPAGMPFPRVTDVEVNPPYRLRLSFEDGTEGEIDQHHASLRIARPALQQGRRARSAAVSQFGAQGVAAGRQGGRQLEVRVQERTQEIRNREKKLIFRISRTTEFRDPETGAYSTYGPFLGSHRPRS